MQAKDEVGFLTDNVSIQAFDLLVCFTPACCSSAAYNLLTCCYSKVSAQDRSRFTEKAPFKVGPNGVLSTPNSWS